MSRNGRGYSNAPLAGPADIKSLLQPGSRVPVSQSSAVLTPDQAAAIGRWLVDRRQSAAVRVEEFLTPLRTTTHQIQALERGNLSAFYGPAFYRTLMLRYAAALGASESELQALGRGDVPSAQQAVAEAADAAEAAEVQEVDEAAPDEQGLGSGLVTEDLPEASVQPSVVQQQPETIQPETKPEVQRVASPLPPAPAEAPSAPPVAEAEAEAEAERTALPSPPPSTPGQASTSVGPGYSTLLIALAIGAALYYWLVFASDSPQPASVSAVPAASSARTLPDTPPSPPVDSQEAASPPPSSSAEPPATPEPAYVGSALRLEATADTWVWMRMPNNDVRQLAVSVGEPLELNELPVYLVVNNPSAVKAWVQGRSLTLERNDPSRNYARLTIADLSAVQAP